MAKVAVTPRRGTSVISSINQNYARDLQIMFASKTFRNIFSEEIDKPIAESFVEKGESHWKDTRHIRDGLGEIFKLV